jgi:hypothetical protein
MTTASKFLRHHDYAFLITIRAQAVGGGPQTEED